MKVRGFVVLSNLSAFHRWSAQSAAHLLLLSDELTSCWAAGTNGCLGLRCRAFPPRYQSFMGRRARNSVAPLRRSPAGWVLARMGRLPVGVGRRHPVTVRKASLGAWSMRREWELRHQTGAQCSAVELIRAKMAVHMVVAPAPLQAASRKQRVMSTFCEVTQGVGNTWVSYPTLLQGYWSQSKRAGFRCCGWLSAHVCKLSGNGGCQFRGVDVPEEGCQDRSLRDAILEAS